MRAPIIILALANLAFAAWALLIDRPIEPPTARDISRLPKLVLVSDPVPGPALPTTSPKAAVAVAAAPGATAGAAKNAHCVTVGPFNDLSAGAAAASLLQSRGFMPRQRAEPGPDRARQEIVFRRAPVEGWHARLRHLP